MKTYKMMKVIINEVIINNNERIIKVKDERGTIFDLTLKENIKIIEDEFYKEVNLENLSVNYPLYIYYLDNENFDIRLLVVAQNEDHLTQSVGFYNDDLIDEKNMLKLNIGSMSIIEDLNGIYDCTQVLKNKNLIVFYSIATRSIPAIITPIKIYILD